ncbi:unnamed protein product, partial [Didymodactylos carnosus]
MSTFQQQYRQSQSVFIYKYEIAQALYNNLTASPSLTFDAFFSTVNYHTMAVSLEVSMTQLFQFYSSSAAKQIITTNMPLITPGNATSSSNVDLLYKLLCFDTLPQTLFGFLNSIIGIIFTSLFILQIVNERRRHSKHLRLMCHLSRFLYWFSNFLYDITWSLLVCALLTVIVKVGAAGSSNADAEILDDDVQNERIKGYSTHINPSFSPSTVVLSKDLMKTFKKLEKRRCCHSCYCCCGEVAGKTTTFRMLTGEYEPTSGQILICGQGRASARKSCVLIGYCPQFDWLIDNLNVDETLTLFARLHGLNEREIKDLCQNTIKLFGLETYERKEVQEL